MSIFSQGYISLDIGTNTIKLSQLDKHKKKAKLSAFGLLKTPVGKIKNGVISDVQEVGSVIEKLVSETKTKRRNAITGVWGSDIVIRKIVSHGVYDPDIICEEASLHIPFDLDQVNIQYKTGTLQGSEFMMLYSASKKVVLGYAETISNAKLTCKVVETIADALQKCFRYNYDTPEGEALAIIDIGEQFTALVILDSGELTFSKDLDFGGNNYNFSIYEHLSDSDVSMEEVESLKKTAPPVDEIAPIINETHGLMVEKIKSYLDHYNSITEYAKVTKIYLTGGGSIISGLKEYFANAFESVMEIEVFDPFRRIVYDKRAFPKDRIEELKPLCSASLGLSLIAGDF